MNLVEFIKEQLPSGLINQLSSQVGASEGATRSAVMATVPAMLSALAGLSSSGGSGTQKLVSALEGLGAGSIESLVPKMSNHPASVLEQGASILSSLFGNSTISGIVNAISKFCSIAPGRRRNCSDTCRRWCSVRSRRTSKASRSMLKAWPACSPTRRPTSPAPCHQVSR